MLWICKPFQEFLHQHANEWEYLNSTFCNSHPLLDLKFITPLLEYFGHNKVYGLMGTTNDGQPVIACFAEPSGYGRWRLFMPSQAAICPIISDTETFAHSGVQCIKGLLQALPSRAWMLGLEKVDPMYSNFLATQPQCSKLIETLPCSITTSINAETSFDIYWNNRSRKIRKSVNSIMNRIASEYDSCELKEIRVRDAIVDAVRDYGDIESLGWKASIGTAIHLNNVQGEFYSEMMRNFAEEGGACAYQLILGNKIAASLLTVQQNGMLVVLKTTYDESLAKFSPGRIIDYLSLQSQFSDQKIRVIENYTNASENEIRWVTDTRSIVNLNFYPSWSIKLLTSMYHRIHAQFWR